MPLFPHPLSGELMSCQPKTGILWTELARHINTQGFREDSPGLGSFSELGVGLQGEQVPCSTKMATWENSREVGRNEKSLGLFPFHRRGKDV